MGVLKYITLSSNTQAETFNRIIPEVLRLQQLLIASRANPAPKNGFLISSFDRTELLTLIHSDGALVCATQENELLGFCLTTPIREFTDLFQDANVGEFHAQESLRITQSSHRYLYQIATAPSKTGTGIGQGLIEVVKSTSNGLPLLTDVLTSPIENAASRQFFRKNGFKPVGELTLKSYRDFGELRSEVLLCI
jgi:ribosomal protein S18 acetylase RimI-like enzyme